MRNASCQRCPLHENAKTVCVPARGPAKPRVVFVFEAPGPDEDRTGQPVQGVMRDLLERALNGAGLAGLPYAVTYAVRCRPFATVKAKEMRACLPYLIDELLEMEPEVVVPMGNLPFKAVTGHTAVTKYAGRPLDGGRYRVFPMQSLGVLLKPGGETRVPQVTADFAALARLLKGEAERPRYRHLSTGEAVDYIDALARDPRAYSIDFETTALNPRFGKIVTAALCTDAGEAVWFEWSEALHEPMFRLLQTDALMVAHNATFELRWLLWHVVTPLVGTKPARTVRWQVADTMLFHHLLDENSPHDLSYLSKIHTDIGGYDDAVESLKVAGHAHRDMPLEVLGQYNAGDADATLRLYHRYWDEVSRDTGLLNVWTQIIKPALWAVSWAELHGRKVNLESAGALAAELRATQERTYEALMAAPEVAEYVASRAAGDKPLKGGEFNLGSAQQVAGVLFDVMGLEMRGVTETGQPSVTEKFLLPIKDKSPWVANYLEWKEAKTLENNYLGPVLAEHVAPDGVIYGSYLLHGTVTGRLACIAKGTPIEMPRDAKKYPAGVPIEDVKVGDLVYSYDDKGALSLRRVEGAQQTGVRETVRLRWRGSGHKHDGELLLTPEHRVRRLDGTWARADELRPGDRIMALSRGVNNWGYARLYARGGEITREHRFIAHQLGWDIQGKHVHHKDHNRLNNHPDNLEVLSPTEHYYEHLPSPEELRSRARYLHTPAARAKMRANCRRGLQIPIGRTTLMRRLACCQGGPLKVARRYGLDYSTVIRQCRVHGVDPRAIAKRYDGTGRFLSRGRVAQAVRAEYRNTNDVQKALRIGYYRVREVCEYYALDHINHEVVSVTPGPVGPVYDLSVEGTRCFIAGEIAVHNSRSPNLQNFSPKLRTIVCSRFPDGRLLEVDFSQLELRLLAWAAGVDLLLEAYKRGDDVHVLTALYVLEKGFGTHRTPETLTKDERQDLGKRPNFGLGYGAYPKRFSEEFGVSLEMAKRIWEAWHALYPEIRLFHEKIHTHVQRTGRLRSKFGRVRRLPGAQSHDRREQILAKLAASNFPTQSLGTDLNTWAFCRISEELARRGLDSVPIGLTHDSTTYDCPEREIPLVAAIAKRVKTKDLHAEFPWLTVPMEVDVKAGLSWGSLGPLEAKAVPLPPNRKTAAAR